MQHTHKTYDFAISEGERRLLSFAGGETPKPESESGEAKVDAAVPSEAKTNERMERDAAERNERRDEDMKKEDAERAEELPKIEREMEEAGDAPKDEREKQKEQVDRYFSDAVDTIRPPLQDVVKAGVEKLDDREKASMLKYETAIHEEIRESAGIPSHMSPAEFGKGLAMTMRYSVFADKEEVKKFLDAFDDDENELIDNLIIKINDRMGDEKQYVDSARGKMKDAGLAFAKANPDVAKQITAQVSQELKAFTAIARSPEFKQFTAGMRKRSADKDAGSLASETETKDKTKEKGIVTQAKKLQEKMRNADGNVTVKGESAKEEGKDPVFKVSFDQMDGSVKDIAMTEAKRQFEGGEIKENRDELVLSGADAMEFMNFLRRMDGKNWREIGREEEKKKEEGKK